MATKTRPRIEVPISDHKLEQALAVANDAVLVGGQALAFWIARYSIGFGEAQPGVYISKDVDFLGTRADVARFAAAVGGKATYPGKREITALHGVVEVNVENDDYVGVDVLRQVIGLRAEDIRKRAVQVAPRGTGRKPFFVMDPVDCLVSRLENLRKLRDKQNEVGVWQASLSIRVCEKHIEQLLADGDEKRAIKVATAIARIAGRAMGVQAFKRHGLRVIECVPVEKFSDTPFKTEFWPRTAAGISQLYGKTAPPDRASSSR